MRILIHTECVHSGGATNMTFIVEGANTVSSSSCAHLAGGNGTLREDLERSVMESAGLLR